MMDWGDGAAWWWMLPMMLVIAAVIGAIVWAVLPSRSSGRTR
jgi:hypothetical protein